MPKFACGFCESKIQVPDQYVGKRVKCPGCGKAVTVPGAPADDPGASLDLSLLDDSMSGDSAAARPRKLRSIVIGCGVCSKTIHIPENRKGAVTPCPKCKTPLLVDVPNLPETAGSTIDFKHLVLDPATEPSLMGDSLAGGTIGGSVASLTSTGSRPGRSTRGGNTAGTRLGATGSFASASGPFTAGPATNSKDQMSELRSLNDLKASGAISDDEYRRRKAQIYSGAGGDATGARKAMSRNVGGASDRAIRVDTSATIPGPIKLLAGVGVLALAGFLVWQYGIKPALRDIDRSTTFASENETPEAQAARRANEQQQADAARQAAEAQAAADAARAAEEAATVTWASLIPQLGPDALEVALVQPGKLGPAPAPSVFELANQDDANNLSDTDPQLAALPSAFDESAAPPTRIRTPPAPPVLGQTGTIAFWDIMYPQAREGHPLARISAFTYRYEQANQSALIGVGIGPAVSGFNDPAYQRWQRLDILQELLNTIGQRPGFESVRPETIDRPQTAGNFTYTQTSLSGQRTPDGQRPYFYLLTGIQDGYAIHYWFEGPLSLQRPWLREAVGKAVIQ